MLKRIIAALTTLVINIFSLPIYVSASQTGIIINELMPNPIGTDSLYEWIELYNYSETSINLKNWSIEGYKFNSDIIIPSKDYLILVRNLSSFPEIANKALANFNLVNTSDEVVLNDNFGNLVDSFSYSSSQEGKSLERKGPSCEGYDMHENNSTLNLRNSNYTNSCYGIQEEVLDLRIEFSTDQLEWFDSIDAISPITLYFRIVDDSGIEYQSNWFDESNNLIESPYQFSNYVNKKLIAKIEDNIIESEAINIVPEIIINEINNTVSNSLSYIELYNPNNFDIDLAKYWVNLNGETLQISSSMTEYNSCTMTIKKFSECAFYKNSNMQSNGVIEVLFNELVVDSINYSFNEGQYNLSRYNEEWYSDLLPTSGFKNIYQTLQISEIYPNINAGESEWIEIYNYGSEPIDLSYFYFTDNRECNSVTTKLFLTGSINESEHIIIDKSKNGVSLNDAGDVLRLCNVAGNEINIFMYNKSVKGKSLSKSFKDGKYIENYSDVQEDNNVPYITTPSPAKLNIIETEETQPTQNMIITIKNAKEKILNSVVRVEGYVTSGYGVLFQDSFYIQDESGGIRVYFKGLNNLVVGSKVIISGKLSEINGEKKINASEIEFVNSSLVFTPYVLQSNSFLEEFEGMYVYAEGFIENNYASSFDIKTSFGLIRVSILSTTNIELGTKMKGDYVKVRGILSQEKDKFRILPFEQIHLEIIPIASNAKVKSAVKKVVNAKSTTVGSKTGVLGDNSSIKLPQLYNSSEDNLDTNNLAVIPIFTLGSGILLVIGLGLFRKDVLKYWRLYTGQKVASILPKLPF